MRILYFVFIRILVNFLEYLFHVCVNLKVNIIRSFGSFIKVRVQALIEYINNLEYFWQKFEYIY